MRLTLWFAINEGDEAYNLTDVTKKALLEKVNEYNPIDFRAFAKVEIRATNGADFFQMVAEGGLNPESYDVRDWYKPHIEGGKLLGLRRCDERPTAAPVDSAA